MKQFILTNKRTAAGITACLLIGLVTLSFQDSPFVHSMMEKSTPLQDTVPVKKHNSSMTMKEFDKLSDDLDKEITEEVRKIDFAKIEQEVRNSLKDVDVDKIAREVEASLKDIDSERILADVKKELGNVNFEEINANTKQAIEQANKELEKAKDEIKNIDKEAIKKEIEQAKLDVEKNREEFKKLDMDKIMKHAQEGIDKAKLELKQLKTMFNEMEADGLINAKNGFNIEYKEKNLYINGTRQSIQVTDKYRKYFKEDHFEITIDKE